MVASQSNSLFHDRAEVRTRDGKPASGHDDRVKLIRAQLWSPQEGDQRKTLVWRTGLMCVNEDDTQWQNNCLTFNFDEFCRRKIKECRHTHAQRTHWAHTEKRLPEKLNCSMGVRTLKTVLKKEFCFSLKKCTHILIFNFAGWPTLMVSQCTIGITHENYSKTVGGRLYTSELYGHAVLSTTPNERARRHSQSTGSWPHTPAFTPKRSKLRIEKKSFVRKILLSLLLLFKIYMSALAGKKWKRSKPMAKKMASLRSRMVGSTH